MLAPPKQEVKIIRSIRVTTDYPAEPDDTASHMGTISIFHERDDHIIPYERHAIETEAVRDMVAN
jgi:hypothetical protein